MLIDAFEFRQKCGLIVTKIIDLHFDRFKTTSIQQNLPLVGEFLSF